MAASSPGRSVRWALPASAVALQDGEYAQLTAKTLAHYRFDIYTGGLLLKGSDGLENEMAGRRWLQSGS